jgi:hypothetical protein
MACPPQRRTSRRLAGSSIRRSHRCITPRCPGWASPSP